MPINKLIAQSPIGIAVIDLEGRFRTVNPAYCKLYGYREEELLGQVFTLVFPPAERESVLQRHRHFLTTGGELKGEWNVVRRDGSLLNILSHSVRVPGDQGTTERLVYVVDITERKRMEMALAASHRFVQSVLDAQSAHICVLDAQGCIVAVNAAWSAFATANAGATLVASLGSSYVNACVRAAQQTGAEGRQAGAFLELLRELLAGTRAEFQFEYPCHSPTEQRWFLARGSRIEQAGGPVIVIAHDDVSSLKQAQEALRSNEALLRDLTASIPGALFRIASRSPRDWQLVYISPGIQDLLGITPEQATANQELLREQLAVEDRELFDAAIRAAMAGGTVLDVEFRVLPGGPGARWIHLHAQPRREDGQTTLWTGVLTDISERKRIEAVLKASEETYRTLFETVPQGVVYQGADGRIRSANPAAQRILGMNLEQLHGVDSLDPRWQAVHEDGSPFPGDEHPSMVALRTGAPVNDVVMGLPNTPGGPIWLLVSASPVLKNGVVSEVYSSFEDITQRVLLGQELRRQATTDYLTSVSNRRSLVELLHKEFEQVRRHPQISTTVLALDLDHFKHVNDTWGHATGDAMLLHLTQLMRQETRQGDIVGRSGGEEFALVLPNTGAERALALAERLRGRVEQTPLVQGTDRIAITVSIGVSVIRADDTSVDDVLRRADLALYEAKNSGRNAVRLG